LSVSCSRRSNGRTSGSRNGAIVGIAPKRSGPDNGAAALRAVSTKSSASASSARAFGHLLPGFGEPHAALVALDELRAEQVFELFDAGRQCGLRYELRLRGRMEVEALGKLDQVGKLTQGGERSHRGRAIG